MSDTAVDSEVDQDAGAPPLPPPPPRVDQFTAAVRAKQLLRLALAGPKGSGKTLTALEVARVLGGRIAVIDTQWGHSLSYAEEFDFSVKTASVFHPNTLVAALASAYAEGYDVVIVDSVSDYWSGPQGTLEQVDLRTRPGPQGSGWKDAGPMQRRMVEALQGVPMHVIVTVRVKTDVLAHRDDSGAVGPATVGLRWEQREGFEYAWPLAGVLNTDNRLILTAADRELNGLIEDRPGEEFGQKLRAWLDQGAEVEPLGVFAEKALAELRRMLRENATVEEVLPLAQAISARGAEGYPFIDDSGKTALLGEVLANLRARLSRTP